MRVSIETIIWNYHLCSLESLLKLLHLSILFRQKDWQCWRTHRLWGNWHCKIKLDLASIVVWAFYLVTVILPMFS